MAHGITVPRQINAERPVARDAAALDWLDRLLDCDPPSRAAWLACLSAGDATLHAHVWRLLQRSGVAGATRALAAPLAWLTEGKADTASGAQAEGLSPGDVVGCWRLERELGRGGMATVWLAHDVAHAGLPAVALKLPRMVAADGRSALAPTLAAALSAERDALAMLGHPNIVRMVEAGTCDDGLPWLALAPVDGVPIDRYCHDAALPLDGRLTLLRQLLDALGHAHARGVVHRDVKPSNVLVDRAGCVRLIDFGIAACRTPSAGNRVTPEPAVAGAPEHADAARLLTPRYAAPEQRRGGAGSAASDLYAVGLLLYELATDQPPPASGDVGTTAPRPSEAAIDPDHARRLGHATVDALRAELRARIDVPVMRALHAAPAGRFTSAAAFVAALRPTVRGGQMPRQDAGAGLSKASRR